MSAHITADGLTRWLVEGPDSDLEAHLRHCLGCQAKLAEVQEPLVDFCQALTGWSEAAPLKQMDFRSDRPGAGEGWNFMNWLPAFGLAGTLAILAILAGVLVVPGFLRKHAERQQAQAPAVSDTVLMDQVDEEVSEAVPDAMAPLADLVAWDSGSTEAKGVASKKIVKKKSATAARATTSAN